MLSNKLREAFATDVEAWIDAADPWVFFWAYHPSGRYLFDCTVSFRLLRRGLPKIEITAVTVVGLHRLRDGTISKDSMSREWLQDRGWLKLVQQVAETLVHKQFSVNRIPALYA